MSKSLLCLSGWAQKFDSLEVIFKNKSLEKQYFINSFDYSIFDNIDELFLQLKQVKNCEIALGWSLGGQLLIRAIANKIINPQLLILIAPPFQMLKDSRISSGMTQELYHKVKDTLENNSADMLRNFLALSSMNDSNSKEGEEIFL